MNNKVKKIFEEILYSKIIILVALLSMFSLTSEAQKISKNNKLFPEVSKNKYGLEIIDKVNDYREFIQIDSNYKLIDLQKFIPKIKLDIRYATENNFTHKVVYPSARAFARLPVAKALLEVQKELNKKGLGLIVFDAYRPYSITLKFWELIKDTNFVAAPWTGSRHNRGCAVDVSIYELITGKEIQMPSGYDDFTAQAFPNNNNFSKEILKNRKMLIQLMQKHGFTVYPTEWWHFDFKGFQKYNLMDIPFEKIEN